MSFAMALWIGTLTTFGKLFCLIAWSVLSWFWINFAVYHWQERKRNKRRERERQERRKQWQQQQQERRNYDYSQTR